VLASLRAAGHHVHAARYGAPDDWRDVDLLWLNGNANWFPDVCGRLERIGARRPGVVVWHSEPLPPRPGSGFRSSPLSFREIAKIVLRDSRATDPYTNAKRIQRLRRFGLPDVLAVSARSRQEYLASHGIESHFIPLGYDAEWLDRPLELKRDVEVLFLGTMQVPRRRRLVAQLRQAGVEVRTEGSWNNRSAWGENQRQLLNRTKVLLNLQRHPGEFSGMRMLLGMTNRALVISEPVDLPEPYVPGRHYIEATVEQMPAVIRFYLEHPDERELIVSEAYRFVSEELTMQASVNRILELANMKLLKLTGDGAALPMETSL